MKRPFLSIIIPAHNEADRLPRTLEQVFAFLQKQPWSAEVLVVENGSHDATLAIAQNFAARHANLRVMQVQTRGKGLAVRAGMLAAHGQYRFMCDADLSMPIEQVTRFLPPQITAEVGVAYGSRETPGAVRYDEPAFRHWGGRFINLLVRLLVLPGIHDTQCGFKCFRADVAEAVFQRQTLNGIAFDVEVLYIAQHLGYSLQAVPIDWYFDPNSRIRLWDDTLAMLRDLSKIRHNAARGRYD